MRMASCCCQPVQYTSNRMNKTMRTRAGPETRPAGGPERTFRCAMCGGTFVCGQTEEEARAELASRFPGVDISACDQVCDDCDRELLRRSAPFWRNGVYSGGPETS